MRLRTLSKNISKWNRLVRLYNHKYSSCKERKGKSVWRFRCLAVNSQKIFSLYLENYVDKLNKKRG